MILRLFKTELIHRRGPMARTVEHVEAATFDRVDWFNHRLLESNGDLPPMELEQAHYSHVTAALTEAG